MTAPVEREPTHPLKTFEESNDYVTCVQWSPLHPGLFADIDISGRLDVWNLSASENDIPVASINVHQERVDDINGRSSVGNKLIWSRDGKRIAVGMGDGNVSLYQVGEVTLFIEP